MLTVAAVFLQVAAKSAQCLTDTCLFCSCVGVEEDKAAEIDVYHCPNCEVTHGPSVSESIFFMFPCHAVLGLCLFRRALIIFYCFCL